jgi:hypothetical protein
MRRRALRRHIKDPAHRLASPALGEKRVPTRGSAGDCIHERPTDAGAVHVALHIAHFTRPALLVVCPGWIVSL